MDVPYFPQSKLSSGLRAAPLAVKVGGTYELKAEGRRSAVFLEDSKQVNSGLRAVTAAVGGDKLSLMEVGGKEAQGTISLSGFIRQRIARSHYN